VGYHARRDRFRPYLHRRFFLCDVDVVEDGSAPTRPQQSTERNAELMDELSPKDLKAEILNLLKNRPQGVTTNALIELLSTTSDDRIKSMVRSLSRQDIIYSEIIGGSPWAIWKLTEDKPLIIECVFCREAVITVTRWGGTTWVHEKDYRELCRPTFASPNLIKYEREKKERQ
jgi:hypothetical protein